MALSLQYQRILQAPVALTTLLRNTNRFRDVLRGFPEDFQRTHQGDIATVFMTSLDYSETHGGRNRPDFLYSTIGLISKGTKTVVHDKIRDNSIFVLSQFESNPSWITLNGNVRNTFITGFNIFPERTAKTMLTTAIIQLKHDVRWRT